jgi:hypothetical protein
VRKEVELEKGVELWAISYFFCSQQWQWCQELVVRVVRQEPVLGSTSRFHLSEEGEMDKEALWVDEDTIQG